MKRKIALAFASALIGITMLMQPANATTQPAGPCTGYGVNRTQGHDYIHARMHKLVRCAFEWAGIGDQVDTAFYVIDRESGFWPWAKNPSEAAACKPWSRVSYGSCGLAQHLSRYWPERARNHLKAWWFPKSYPQVSPLNARANALVTALMVRSGGWGPWA